MYKEYILKTIKVLLSEEFFTLPLGGGFSLELERQQVSSNPHNSSQYSSWS